MFDYASLRIIWWLLLGLLLIGFAIMDGFDLGIGMLLYRITKNNDERRIVLNTIGPVWEGNQAWLILGAGAIFAAWPMLYAISFSGFYFVMLLILTALILRPLGFKYRSKIDNTSWRLVWDGALFFAGLIPALCFGIAIGNVLLGVPFYFDESLRAFYTGSLLSLLNPFALLCGLVSVSMLSMHGAVYLTIKTKDIIQQRAIKSVYLFVILTIIFFALAGFWIAYDFRGYALTSNINIEGPSNPLYKLVAPQLGAWLNNYNRYPWFIGAPAAGFLGALATAILTVFRRYIFAWICSAISISGIIATVGLSMFPFILPSSTYPNMSLMVWDTSSSQLTLLIMLIATIIFLPLIIVYTSWVYYILRGKITHDYIEKNKLSVY